MADRAECEGFNPCFSGTRARTLHGPRGVQMKWSFNPCFSGTRARTFFVVIRPESNPRVSILVFLELAPGLPIEDVIPNPKNEFQSLFFWNSRPDQTGPLGCREGEAFQSLFFWNSRPDTEAGKYDLLAENVFQSLFFWNSRPDGRSQVSSW